MRVMILQHDFGRFIDDTGAVGDGVDFVGRAGVRLRERNVEHRALARRLRSAKLKERGSIEDIDYQHPRGLDRKLMRTLSSSDWVRQTHNILLIGPTGIGKSWLGCALAQKAR